MTRHISLLQALKTACVMKRQIPEESFLSSLYVTLTLRKCFNRLYKMGYTDQDIKNQQDKTSDIPA